MERMVAEIQTMNGKKKILNCRWDKSDDMVLCNKCGVSFSLNEEFIKQVFREIAKEIYNEEIGLDEIKNISFLRFEI